MSDFVSGFWSVYVTLLTLVSVVGCGVFLWVQSKAKATAASSGEVKTMGHVWDGDLAEYNNPLPRWWSWLFYITVVFALGYLAAYPGLGSYQGAFKWRSLGQYEGEMQQAEAQYAPIFARFQSQDIKAVAADPEAKKMGERLFLTYCAQCHGSDARGAKGFPNLTDQDWLWGGEPEQIKTSILEGRQGVMPPHAQLGAEPGNDLRLTIDLDVQQAAETALAETESGAGAVVALDPVLTPDLSAAAARLLGIPARLMVYRG